jgi:hypothetical protein
MDKTPAEPDFVSPATQRTVRGARGRKVDTAPRGQLRKGEVLGRDGEVLSRSRSTGFRNDFEVPSHLRQDGWDYQWVRNSCHGKPDPANVSAHLENGWRPVASKATMQHYGVADGATIERDGLILCERPMTLTQEALAEERRSAVELRQAQGEAFGKRKLPDGFDDGAVSSDGRFDARRKIRRTVEGAPSEFLPKRELAVGDDD